MSNEYAFDGVGVAFDFVCFAFHPATDRRESTAF